MGKAIECVGRPHPDACADTPMEDVRQMNNFYATRFLRAARAVGRAFTKKKRRTTAQGACRFENQRHKLCLELSDCFDIAETKTTKRSCVVAVVC